MGWSLVQSVAPASVASGATSAAAFPANVTAGNRILLYSIRVTDNIDVNTPTDTQGNTYTRIVQNNTAMCLSIWTAVIGTTGANTITVTAPASSQYGWTAQEYAGLDSSLGAACLDVSANGTNGLVATNPTTGITSATHAGSQLAIAFAADWGDAITGLQPPSGFTKTSGASRENDANAQQVIGVKTSDNGATEGGTCSGFYTAGSSDKAGSVAVIKKAASATAPALEYVSSTISAAAASATATPVNYPASIASGDLLVLIVGTKPYSATIATPSGWTPQGTTTNGTTAAGTDTGSTEIAAFTKVAAGTETGTLTLSITNGVSSWASISRITKDPAKNWDIANTTGTMAAATNFTSTLAANPGITADDLIFVAAANSTDIACTWSAQRITATGASFSAPLDPAGIQNPRITTSNDSGGNIQWFRCWSGTATTAPVWAGTHSVSTNQAASTVLVRIRQLAPATQSINLADSGTATTDLTYDSTTGQTYGYGYTGGYGGPLSQSLNLTDSGTATADLSYAGVATYGYGYTAGYGGPLSQPINLTDNGAASSALSYTTLGAPAYGYGYTGGYGDPISQPIGLTDSSVGTTDDVSTAATTLAADSATASQTFTLTGQTRLAESAGSLDSQAVAALTSLADTAVASDTISNPATLGFTADASAADTITVDQAYPLADTANAIDDLRIGAVQLQVNDAGSASETSTVTITSAPGIEFGTATDNIIVVLAERSVAVTDLASATETLTKTVTLATRFDFGVATQTISVDKDLLLQDSATSTQIMGRLQGDSGVAADRLTATAAVRLTDSGAAGNILSGITTAKLSNDRATATTEINILRPAPPTARNATHAATIRELETLNVVSGAPTTLQLLTVADGRATIVTRRGIVAVDYR